MQDWLDEKGNYIDYSVTIGENFQMGFNNVIGLEGFGFEKDKEDNFIYPLKRQPHDFGVIIKDNVELGSCVTIDRGRWRDTEINNYVKIDNLVHIGHNAVIGDNTFLVAGTIIGGSATIGQRCKLYMNCSIFPGVTVGDNATIGAGSVVIHDVRDNEVVYGNPARTKQILGFSE